MNPKANRISYLQLMLGGLGACATLAFAAGPAGVKLDGTLGGSTATLTGPTYNITQSLGQLAGGNLFFSFQYFNIATSETARFSTTSAGINNVISRVTGGYASTIDGQIELVAASGTPNFYFINPSGVTFTANASINVPAAFAVTTANYLKFSNGNFYADPSKASTLSSMAPEAFGFLGTTRAPVNIEGAQLPNALGGGGEFQVVAGDVTIDGGGGLAAINTTSGDVRVIATGSQAVEVPVSGTFNSTDGSVTLQGGGEIYSEAAPGSASGGIYVSAGTLQIDGTNSVYAPSDMVSFASSGAGPIRVDVAGTVSINNGGVIYSGTAANSAGAPITINAGAVTIQGEDAYGFSGVKSATSGAGAGGAITLNVGGAANIVNGGYVWSNTVADGAGGAITMNVAGATNIQSGGYVYSNTAANGTGAPITVNTSALTIEGANAYYASDIDSTANGTGVGGAIAMNVTGPTLIANGGYIYSGTAAGGAGGPITMNTNTLTLDGENSSAATVVQSATSGPGAGGAITLNVAAAATVGGGGAVMSTTEGAGNAGAIALTAASLSIDGVGSAISSSSGNVDDAPGAPLGNAGEVSITTSGTTTLTNAASIGANTFSGGNAGNITVTAGSLDLDGAGTFISSSSSSGATGNAALVSLTTNGTTTLTNGAQIGSNAYGAGNAGGVTLQAAALDLDANSAISSASNAAGNAGVVSVSTSGATTLTNGSNIFSDTFGAGNAGTVTLKAGSLDLETDSSISSASKSSGNAGQVSVITSGATTLTNGQITATAAGSGNAGNVTLTAASLSLNGASSVIDSASSSSGSAGQVSVSTSGATILTNGAAIDSDTSGSGNAGTVTLQAASLDISGAKSEIDSKSTSTGNAGLVSVTTSGPISLTNGAFIDSETSGSGNAGTVMLNAASLNLDQGSSVASGSSLYSTGNGGLVSVTTSGATTITNGSEINSTTFGAGNAGNVTLVAASLDLDTASSISSATKYADGHGGLVSVTTSGATTISNGSLIFTNSFGAGNAGNVMLEAGSLDLEGFGISSASSSTGNAGLVSVITSGATTITNGAYIASSTTGAGNAGTVTVNAASLNMDGERSQINSSTYATGNAGLVSVTTSGATTLTNGAYIASSTTGAGNAGDVTVNAASLDVDATSSGSAFTGVDSSAGLGSSGNAGKVSISTSGATTIVNGAEILSITSGLGSAGDVTLKAGSLTVEDGKATENSAISTTATLDSSGQAGTVTVDVSGMATVADYAQISSAAHGAAGQTGTVAIRAGTLVVDQGGIISIQNSSTVADPERITPTEIDLNAGTIQMNGGQITAASSGNIAASAIDISYRQTLHMDPSSITTTSNQGNGGPITITGQGLLWLQNSSITTSVLGTTNGNGGDIRISVPFIVLDSGVIQANTTAPQASGGNVVISAEALIPSFESYVLGGAIVSFDSALLGQNVVQAAAPDGVSGTLNVTVPSLDLGSALLGLTGTPSTPIALSRSLCTYRRGSSLSVAGRGGLPISYRDPLWIDLGEAASGTPANAAPSAERSTSDAPFQGFSLIACR